MRKTILFAPVFLLAACAGKVTYSPPSAQTPAINSVTIDAPLDSVWSKAVPQLGKQFFVINNLDKASGLINVSYSGNPEKYIDCGWISSHVQNMHGTRNYEFPAASAYQAYEVLQGPNYAQVNRKMELEGRVNLIFEAINSKQTRVSANTKYIVTKTITSTSFVGAARDSIDFNSGGGAKFAGQAPTTECRATGILEQEILNAVSPAK